MILGRAACFVSPSDSVAVIAAHARTAIPYFHAGIKGLSRSAHNTMLFSLLSSPLSSYLSLSLPTKRASFVLPNVLFSIMTVRSMPTGAALDRVAAKLGVKMFEVPTGKFVGPTE